VHSLDLVKVDVLGVPPQNGQHQVVHVRDGLVHIVEEHVQKILLGERGGVSDDELLEEGPSGGEARLMDKHAGVEVERRRGHAELSLWPGDLVGALLAVADLVLRSVAPCLLTKAVLDGVEAARLQLEQVVHVVVHLDVRVQIHHLLILNKLHHKFTIESS
jgi:hypothetical protein